MLQASRTDMCNYKHSHTSFTYSHAWFATATLLRRQQPLKTFQSSSNPSACRITDPHKVKLLDYFIWSSKSNQDSDWDTWHTSRSTMTKKTLFFCVSEVTGFDDPEPISHIKLKGAQCHQPGSNLVLPDSPLGSPLTGNLGRRTFKRVIPTAPPALAALQHESAEAASAAAVETALFLEPFYSKITGCHLRLYATSFVCVNMFYKHTRAHPHAHTHTYSLSLSLTHTHTHAHTHTHTQKQHTLHSHTQTPNPHSHTNTHICIFI